MADLEHRAVEPRIHPASGHRLASQKVTPAVRRDVSALAVSARTRALVVVVVAVAIVAAGCASDADGIALPERVGPRTETSHTVPHVQHFVEPVVAVDNELRNRIYSLPGVESRETIVAFTGTTALWLNEELEFANPDTTLREREFAHIHPDGSLHAVLSVELAIEATTTKWAELHPWVGRDDFWDGMVMLYTPQDQEELEITWRLIVESYNLVTGENLDANDFAG